ncbi:TPA: hypothetical protein ACH3X2_011840 [Trebouxia sp. C0005]
MLPTYLAIVTPTLQNLEVFNIWQKQPGHVEITVSSAAAAQKLQRAPLIQISLEDKFEAYLMSDNTATDHTLDYSIVSDKITFSDFTNAALYKHTQQLIQESRAKTTLLAQKQLICTPAEDVCLKFYSDTDDVIDAEDITQATIPHICFSPRNLSKAYMPAGLAKAQATSASGLCLMWKPADQLTAVLIQYVITDQHRRRPSPRCNAEKHQESNGQAGPQRL